MEYKRLPKYNSQDNREFTTRLLGKKRDGKDLSNNFIFRPLISGIVEGDYEKVANLYKHLYSFNWDDEKIVKNKHHPSKIIINFSE